MNGSRYRVVAIGENSPTMMSEITQDLFNYGCEIETISSLRLGHSFVVVLMIDAYFNERAIKTALEPVTQKYNLELSINACTREKFQFVKSDAFIRINGVHAPGISASVIKKFTEAGLEIHGLESDIYNENGDELYVCNIKGKATTGIENLSLAAEKLKLLGLDLTVATDWKLLA